MTNILSLLLTFIITSFYSLQVTTIDGGTINMSSYEHKKILLVNIATNSPKTGQLTQLQQLQQQEGDSLVIIAFPSNSFGNETRTDAQIKAFCQNTYGTTFTLAAKNSVVGTNAQAVYNWAAHTNENGVMDVMVGADFQKILIDKDGTIGGVFGPSVSPIDSSIIAAIHTNF